ncbi:MAG: hypothetical protein ACK4M9_01085 [Anaerobacillus sp.]|uniref:hypothetical protein n=1 Tax=Anaerobacillus sp. TaxID=1872506 RepID=UPI00391CC0DE
MSKDKDLTIYELLKLLGMKSETKIRSYIHSLLEDEEMITLLKKGVHRHLNCLTQLQKKSETISQQLNIPTKNDVANIAKLGVQLEEKIDAIDEQVRFLIEALQNGTPDSSDQVTPLQETIVDNLPSNLSSEENDAQITNEITELKRLLKMNVIMNAGNLQNHNDFGNLLEAIVKRGHKRDKS